MTESAVIIEALCFGYERSEVLHEVSLDMPIGSLLAVVGPNGGGKSTLLRLILGLLRPGHGRVRVFGQSPLRVRRRMAYVPQHLAFDPAFPVLAEEVVLMGRIERHLLGGYRRADRYRVAQAMEQARCRDLAQRPFAALSGGERQRVLIAQALAAEPELLLLDEPTANVDRETEQAVHDLLGELVGQITTMVVSHNLNVVTRHATHVACVNRGMAVHPLGMLSDCDLEAAQRGDLAVLHHAASCHVHVASHTVDAAHGTGG